MKPRRGAIMFDLQPLMKISRSKVFGGNIVSLPTPVGNCWKWLKKFCVIEKSIPLLKNSFYDLMSSFSIRWLEKSPKVKLLAKFHFCFPVTFPTGIVTRKNGSKVKITTLLPFSDFLLIPTISFSHLLLFSPFLLLVLFLTISFKFLV